MDRQFDSTPRRGEERFVLRQELGSLPVLSVCGRQASWVKEGSRWGQISNNPWEQRFQCTLVGDLDATRRPWQNQAMPLSGSAPHRSGIGQILSTIVVEVS